MQIIFIFWQMEVATLRQQVQNLQNSNRQLMGEELSGLTVRDLQFLQSQVEMSLQSIRKRKEKLLAEEIMRLNQKGIDLQKENIELKKEISIGHQHKIELQKKLSWEITSGDGEQASSSNDNEGPGKSTAHDTSERISLTLSLDGADE
ncbi:hypothetical protein U9M48_020111 [Paspalum notatum var. saurae]|uniref:K-box domain-containing protein n=1 Tax=Paspalum notatum var. saurae TaxID=547442 RepID=A0AAQ3TEE3_PASNO